MNHVIKKIRTLATKKKLRWHMSITAASFVLMVVIPTVLVGLYYTFVASDQYRSETLFAVRGTTTSPLSALGLAALPGANVQSGDSYIVSDYIRSTQIVLDALNQVGVDLREYFSNDQVDFFYRIDPKMPFEEFVKYWRNRSAVEFNSTTGITTFTVKAFSAKDAHDISQIVISVAEKLVNRLSDSARKQLISTAQDEVSRTEARLKSARSSVEDFRNKEQALDPQLVAQSEQAIIKELQVSLVEVQARRSALGQTTKDSPTLRVLDRQISAIEKQIEEQRKRVGSGANVSGVNDSAKQQPNLSRIYTAYSGLLLEQEFAEKAYTAALTALEQALVEARKQERYFAVVVDPTHPDAALYPLSFINTFLTLVGLSIIWIIFYLIIQSVRDHAI
ncbi:hypothetical protein [Brucella pituitosa]|uniref:hypothetical protein n=1 Tax=Brucella pituitosa TaxID=571256 RepID=UPI003F4AB916